MSGAEHGKSPAETLQASRATEKCAKSEAAVTEAAEAAEAAVLTALSPLICAHSPTLTSRQERARCWSEVSAAWPGVLAAAACETYLAGCNEQCCK